MNKRLATLWITILLILLAALIAFLAPPEKTLGESARLIYFHAGWVWAALFSFAFSGLLGLIGLFSHKANLLSWSVALQRSALVFWLLFLPMSLWVMQVSWNGLFLAEPRVRIPLHFAIVGLLLQAATTLISKPPFSGLVNFLFAAGLFLALGRAEYILHPQLPILNEQAGTLRFIFLALVLLLSGACWGLAASLTRSAEPAPQNSHSVLSPKA